MGAERSEPEMAPRGYSHFACSLRQAKIIRNVTSSGFGMGSRALWAGAEWRR